MVVALCREEAIAASGDPLSFRAALVEEEADSVAAVAASAVSVVEDLVVAELEENGSKKEFGIGNLELGSK